MGIEPNLHKLGQNVPFAWPRPALFVAGPAREETGGMPQVGPAIPSDLWGDSGFQSGASTGPLIQAKPL